MPNQPDASAVRTVHGEVVLPGTGRFAPSARLIVVVEDVSRADAPSIEIGRQVTPTVPLVTGRPLLFAVEVPAHLIEPGHRYAVRAHLDTTKSGDVTVGDLVSTQSHPVLTLGAGERVTVPVRLVI